ncbi:MAG TPA: GNAT family N-acetyltransferase [Patescibacteria group bacterium]|nr:GNAT family N-acetyltransferase [Patescibacteria group bacterium]
MTLARERRAIRQLLNEYSPADAQAVYYAFHHPDEKTTLVPIQDDEKIVSGYVCLSRTGIDLFRPLITLRLPLRSGGVDLDLSAGAELIRLAIPPGMGAIISAPAHYLPLLGGLFDINSIQHMDLFVLDKNLYQPIINVLVSKTDSYNGLPRYVIRQSSDGQHSSRGEIVASAGLNWRSDRFAEMYVHTKSSYRRKGMGRSVVAALVQSVLEQGQIPLYVVGEDNAPSKQLAESIGFVKSDVNEILIEGVLRVRH